MKLQTQSFNDDYHNRDVGVGSHKSGKAKREPKLKRGVKHMANKARRNEDKKVCSDS